MKKRPTKTPVLLAVLFSSYATGFAQSPFHDAGGSGFWRTPTPGQTVNGITLGPLATTPYPGLLQVRADQIPVTVGCTQAQQNNTFETRGDVNQQQFWRMYRGNSDVSHQWGRLYVTETNSNLGFNIQQMQQNGSLWLRNVRNRPNGVAAGQTDLVFTGNGFRLIDDLTFNLNQYTGNGRCGYVAIGHTFSMDQAGMAAAPWSRMHLVHQNNVDNTALGDAAVWQRRLGYRPWMRNGTMITGNKDQMYIGHKYRYTAGTVPQGNEIVDASDAVIQWADTLGSLTPRDNMRFIFTSSPDNTTNPTTGARSVEGLELMRLHPADSIGSIVPYVGLGDFYRLGVLGATDPLPTERLDIANGRMRHRQLPNDQEMTDASKVVVVNSNGLIGWRTFPTGGAADCDWDPALGDIATAWRPNGSNGACPEEDNKVGIGTNTPAAKLHVSTQLHGTGLRIDQALNSGNTGLDLNVTGTTGTSIGADVAVGGGSTYNVGVYSVVNTTNSGGSSTAGGGTFDSQSTGANFSWGVDAIARGLGGQCFGTIGRSIGAAGTNIGSVGYSRQGVFSFVGPGGNSRVGVAGLGHSDDAATVVYGVYGQAGGPDDINGVNGHTKWAGYFPGFTYTPGGVWSSSDENLKENIESYPPDLAHEQLMATQAIRFTFNTTGYPRLGLPPGPQIGVGATNIEQVVPELVMNTKRPADVSSDGEVLTEEMVMKVVNYQGFTPLLITGYQHQAQQLAQQQQQLTALQEQLSEALATLDQLQTEHVQQVAAINDCCMRTMSAVQDPSAGNGDLRTERLQIIPNPVAPSTTLRYYVAHAGRVRLELSAEDGRALETLLEMRAVEGEQQYTWDTSRLSAGVYMVALVVDEQVVVKRAVKVD